MPRQCNWTKAFVVARNVAGTAGLVLVAYLFVKSVPDVGRYIRISRM
jgi:hypothetical protein